MAASFRGVYAAAVTPYGPDGHPSGEQMASLLQHLSQRGCHGALVSGTTGEGPSLSVEERLAVFRAAAEARSGLLVLAGTGAASLEDAVTLTRGAFDAGCDAALVIPPFFFVQASDDGLFEFFAALMERAVPADGRVLLYHNPIMAAVGLSQPLIRRLRDSYPQQIVGIKDSSGDPAHTRALLETLPDFDVFVGNDRLLGEMAAAGGAGAVTLVANAFPDLARAVFDACEAGDDYTGAQARLDAAHAQLDGLSRIPAVKTLLKAGGVIQNDLVRPPLVALSDDQLSILRQRFMLDEEIPTVLSLSDLAQLLDSDSR